MPKTRTYTFGTTPKVVIRKALKRELGDKPYEMTLSISDEVVVTRIVNQGIDSALEAITGMTQRREERNRLGNRLQLTFSHEDMLVLLRRLFEDGEDEALSLRSAILDSLGIEEA